MTVKDGNRRMVAENRRARRDFEIQDTLEAGLALTGSEVKSLRNGKASIAESYAGDDGGELYLYNAHIAEYPQAGPANHEPRRTRKLLLHKRELAQLINGVQRRGMTVVPLKLYFNERGLAKLEIALARGRKLHDKREVEKKRDWQRQKARLLREKG